MKTPCTNCGKKIKKAQSGVKLPSSAPKPLIKREIPISKPKKRKPQLERKPLWAGW